VTYCMQRYRNSLLCCYRQIRLQRAEPMPAGKPHFSARPPASADCAANSPRYQETAGPSAADPD